MTMRQWPSIRAFALAAMVAAPACSATTGIDIEFHGADQLGIDHVEVTGTVGDSGPMHMATAPSPARPLAADEDVRIVLPDDFADQVVWVDIKSYKGADLVDDQPGAAILVRNHTKRIHVCYGGGVCPPASM
jgi:hypothetical protein